jgi:hypothetical protein
MSDARDALAGGGWTGPIRFDAAGEPYAGAVRLVDVDEEERIVGAYAQARRLRGWGGVAAAITARADDRGEYALEADVRLSGEATDEAGEALVETVRARLARAEPVASPADDPAWRRKLAARAALAVAVGAAAGLAGAAWDRRRRRG